MTSRASSAIGFDDMETDDAFVWSAITIADYELDKYLGGVHDLAPHDLVMQGVQSANAIVRLATDRLTQLDNRDDAVGNDTTKARTHRTAELVQEDCFDSDDLHREVRHC